jgi:CheY-like chemotaxis protein
MSNGLPPQPLLVLAVDRESDTADSLASLLSLWGYRARVANSGSAALCAASEVPPDAVFLDIGLPDMTGWELASRLRQLPGMKRALLVVVSGLGRPDDLARSQKAGCDLHLLKPADPELLHRLLAVLRPHKENNGS